MVRLRTGGDFGTADQFSVAVKPASPGVGRSICLALDLCKNEPRIYSLITARL